MKYKVLLSEEKWILKGILILFLIGSSTHFLYELSGEKAIVGAIVAVNESPWEHLKMVLMPLVLYYTSFYIISSRKKYLDKNKWFTAALVAMLTAMLTIPLLFYFYTGAFGIELLAVDVFILFLAIVFGQLVALHVYKYSKGINANITIGIIIVIVIWFIVVTFYTPELPIFMDPITGGYGIDF